MKTKLKILAVATMFFAAGIITAQEAAVKEENEPKWERKVRPVRIGGKIGFPNLIGGNLEYVTPLLNKKLAVSFDYSVIKLGWFIPEDDGYNDGYENEYEDTGNFNLDFNYIGGGLNYYFFKPGRGLYGGIGYGAIKVNGTISVEDEDDFERTGTGTVEFSHNSFNVKLGAKLGGLFYFRPEVGYSFSPLPESYDMKVVFDDGSTESHTEEIDTEGPVGLLFSGLIANIGLGFAF